jgi:preprotein translocase subunit SecA
VLIRFLDSSWKDHLYAMDLLRNSIGLQAFAERDPRVLYKKEGYRFFEEMMMGVREKVTDLIFKATLRGPVQAEHAYHVTPRRTRTRAGTAWRRTSARSAPATKRRRRRPRAARREGRSPRPYRPRSRQDRPSTGPCPLHGSGKKYTESAAGANAA